MKILVNIYNYFLQNSLAMKSTTVTAMLNVFMTMKLVGTNVSVTMALVETVNTARKLVKV